MSMGSVILVGLPAAIGTLLTARGFAKIERKRLRALGYDLPPATYRPITSSARTWLEPVLGTGPPNCGRPIDAQISSVLRGPALANSRRSRFSSESMHIGAPLLAWNTKCQDSAGFNHRFGRSSPSQIAVGLDREWSIARNDTY